MDFTPLAFRPFMNGNKSAPNYGEFMTADAQQYYNENMGALAAQKRIVPATIEAERGMLPQLQQYQRESMGQQGSNLLGQYSDMYNMTGGTQMSENYSNDLMGMYGRLGAQATNNSINSLGAQGTANYNMFQQQAGEGLALGSSLSAQDTTAAQQTARAAMAARGLSGNQAVGQEVLNSYQLGNQRQQQRQQMASQAYQMAGQQQAFGANAYMAPAVAGGEMFGLQNMMGATQQSFNNLGGQFLQPESQYLANIRANRMQQENADKAASAQRSAGIMGAVGSVAGAYLGATLI
jgi:hypothetical protein